MTENLMKLLEGILKSDFRYISKAITVIENNSSGKEELIDELWKNCGRAVILGITGSPGSGKSTLVDRIIAIERKEGRRVAVLAVDPSSPYSGGAILGDRLRMQEHSTDEGVFIRSMASRGHLGGVALATCEAIKVFDAAGFDTIIIETIGVGQTEIEVVELSDIVILVLVPRMGDEIQAMKAGIMEIGDFFVINKSDLDGADKLKSEIEYVLGMQEISQDELLSPQVFMTSAKENKGIKDLICEVEKYFTVITNRSILDGKRRCRLKIELEKILQNRLFKMMDQHLDYTNNFDEWIDSVYSREMGPYKLIDLQMKKISEWR